MEALVGKWKSNPADLENAEAYAKALNQPQIIDEMKSESEAVISKDGDDFLFISNRAGAQTLKQVLHADGRVDFESETIPSSIVKLTHRSEGGNVIIEGTVGGVETKSVMAIKDGKMAVELTTAGVSMKSGYTRA